MFSNCICYLSEVCILSWNTSFKTQTLHPRLGNLFTSNFLLLCFGTRNIPTRFARYRWWFRRPFSLISPIKWGIIFSFGFAIPHMLQSLVIVKRAEPSGRHILGRFNFSWGNAIVSSTLFFICGLNQMLICFGHSIFASKRVEYSLVAQSHARSPHTDCFPFLSQMQKNLFPLAERAE